jgi:hypothetical protein
LDDILLERRSLLQETASSTQKVKREGKSEKEREKLKQLLRATPIEKTQMPPRGGVNRRYQILQMA